MVARNDDSAPSTLSTSRRRRAMGYGVGAMTRSRDGEKGKAATTVYLGVREIPPRAPSHDPRPLRGCCDVVRRTTERGES
jgi:hypothetical protein